MGKYIIETDGNTADDIGGYLGIPIEICKKRTWVKTDMELTPYTEPDMEQVKEEAYLKGLNDGQGVILESTQNNAFNNGYKKCLEDMEPIRKEAYGNGYEAAKHECEDCPKQAYTDTLRMDVYQKGLSDAWEAARKIALTEGLGIDGMYAVFGTENPEPIFREYSANECIEKIRQYEQEKEEQIHVGDEVKNTQTDARFIVTHMWVSNHGEKGVSGFNYECSAFSTGLDLIRKTGRHFPEIAEVLQKMKEEDNG